MKAIRASKEMIVLEPEENTDARENDLLKIKYLMKAYFKVSDHGDAVLTAKEVSDGIFSKFGLLIPIFAIQEVIDSM